MAKKIVALELIAILVLLARCGDNPLSPSKPSLRELTERVETDNFIFHFASGDYVNPSWQEEYHAWATQQLGVTVPKKIDYFKYISRQHMGELTGFYTTNAWADPAKFAIHTIWPTDNHESVHLYMSLIGDASSLFSEGMAVAFQVNPARNDFEARWGDQTVHSLAKQFKQTGKLIALDNLLESNGFRSYPSEITYPEAGSFIRFMIDSFGLENMKDIFRTGSKDDSKEIIKEKFKALYGFSIEQAEKEWLEFLDKY